MISVEKPGTPEELMHVGTKGMKWGVRKNQIVDTTVSRGLGITTTGSRARATGKTESLNKDGFNRKDARWLKKTHGANLNRGRLHGKTTEKIIKDANKNMKPEIKALNKKPEYSSLKMKRALRKERYNLHPKDPTVAAYHKAQSVIYMTHIKNAAPKHMKVSPSGKWEDELIVGKNYWYVGLKRVDGAKHAAISNPDIAFKVRPIFDVDGYIVDYEIIDDSMAQSVELGSRALMHMGIKI